MQALNISASRLITLRVSPIAQTADCGEPLTIRAVVRNGTRHTLDSRDPHPLYVACHWLDSEGRHVTPDAARCPLAADVPPGAEQTCELTAIAPERPGKYVLRATLVQEHIRWFDEPGAGVAVDLAVDVAELPWWDPAAPDAPICSALPALNRRKYKRFLSHQGRCRPLMLHVETVNICNLRCVICPYDRMSRAKETMSMALFEKIVGDYSDLGGGDVILTPQVGDVLLDRFLLERIRLLRAAPGIRSIGFVTNALRAAAMPEADLEEVVNACTRINISVYGLDEEEGRLMTRRAGYYAKFLGALRRIHALNRRATLVLAFRFLRRRDDSAVRAWIRDTLGADLPWGAISEFGNWGGAMDTLMPLPLDGRWTPPDSSAAWPCAYPVYHQKVMVNGDVHFCSCVDYDSSPGNRLGNAAQSTLAEIWNGPRARELWREGLPMCRGCTHRKPVEDVASLVRYFWDPIRFLGV